MDEPTRLSVERIARIDQPRRLHCRLKTSASRRKCRRQEDQIGSGQREDPFEVSDCKFKQGSSVAVSASDKHWFAIRQ
jgi:hypothetical protein